MFVVEHQPYTGLLIYGWPSHLDLDRCGEAGLLTGVENLVEERDEAIPFFGGAESRLRNLFDIS